MVTDEENHTHTQMANQHPEKKEVFHIVFLVKFLMYSASQRACISLFWVVF